MKLIYLHLYKDTYLIFMQAYKLLSDLLFYSKNFLKMCFPKLKEFTNSEIRFLTEIRL